MLAKEREIARHIKRNKWTIPLSIVLAVLGLISTIFSVCCRDCLMYIMQSIKKGIAILHYT